MPRWVGAHAELAGGRDCSPRSDGQTVWLAGCQLKLLDDCVIDSRGCDESIPCHSRTQVGGPPWPLPSGPFSLSRTSPCAPPFCHRLTDLTRPPGPSRGLINPINCPLNQSSASSYSPSLPPDNEITPASSSILPHAHIPKRPNVRPPSSIIHSRPDCLRRLQRSHSADAVPIHSLLRSSFSYTSHLAMASRIDKNSGFSGERFGHFHVQVVNKPWRKAPVRPGP